MPEAREFAGAVTAADLDIWKSEFETVCVRFEGRWYRTESREHFRQYLRGLLAPLARKNSWTISEFTGERRPTAVQRFINLTAWDADGLRDDVRAYAMEYFADPRAVLIADPTGFAKKGRSRPGCNGTPGRSAGSTTVRSARSGLRQQHRRPGAHRSGTLYARTFLVRRCRAAGRG